MNENERTKRCGVCDVPKPLSEFHKDNHRKDFTHFACKPCRSEWHRRNRGPRLLFMRVAAAKQAAKRYGVESTLTNEELLFKVMDNNNRCEHCRGGWYHVHHKTPMSQGGPNSIENIALLCVPCHREVHAEMRQELVAA